MNPSQRQTAVAGDADVEAIPDDLFASLPSSPFTVLATARAAVDDELDLLATLPQLPSVLGLADRLAQVQAQLEEARAEAESLRDELRANAGRLRAMADALTSI